MVSRKTSLDSDAEIEALEAQISRIKAAAKLRIGELVMETGAHKVFSDPDEFRAMLVRACSEVKEKRVAAKEGKAGTSGTFPSSPKSVAKLDGNNKAEPPRSSSSDLLASSASGRAGPRPSAEGQGHERAP